MERILVIYNFTRAHGSIEFTIQFIDMNSAFTRFIVGGKRGEVSKAAIKIDLYLYEIFVDTSFGCFTMSELCDAYMEESELYTNSDRKLVRTWLYGQLKRLIKNRIVVKLNEQSIERSFYVKTDLFYYTRFNVDGHILDPIKSYKKEGTATLNQNHLNELKYRAKQYRVDLMTTLTESEEHMRMIKAFPDLTPMLKDQYHQSRTKSIKLLGKLKAVEVILSEMNCYEA